mgnify:CR=1 FL=1
MRRSERSSSPSRSSWSVAVTDQISSARMSELGFDHTSLDPARGVLSDPIKYLSCQEGDTACFH